MSGFSDVGDRLTWHHPVVVALLILRTPLFLGTIVVSVVMLLAAAEARRVVVVGRLTQRSAKCCLSSNLDLLVRVGTPLALAELRLTHGGRAARWRGGGRVNTFWRPQLATRLANFRARQKRVRLNRD